MILIQNWDKVKTEVILQTQQCNNLALAIHALSKLQSWNLEKLLQVPNFFLTSRCAGSLSARHSTTLMPFFHFSLSHQSIMSNLFYCDYQIKEKKEIFFSIAFIQILALTLIIPFFGCHTSRSWHTESKLINCTWACMCCTAWTCSFVIRNNHSLTLSVQKCHYPFTLLTQRGGNWRVSSYLKCVCKYYT